MYMFKLLSQGFGFASQDRVIEFTGTVKDVTVSWTVGAMLVNAQLLPSSTADLSLDVVVFLSCTIGVVLGLVVFIPLAMLFVAQKPPKNKRGSIFL